MKRISFAMMTLFLLSCYSVAYAKILSRTELKDLVKSGHRPKTDYRAARLYLFGKIHLKTDGQGYYVEDVYCHGVVRHKVGPDSIPNPDIINTEHTWPKSRFNKNEVYDHQLTDLHHLYPTNSRANAMRGNLFFSEFSDADPLEKNCQTSRMGVIRATGSEGFEPPSEHKGNVARALFYFAIRYDLVIPAHEEEYLRQWHAQDPVDADEANRNDLVEEYQGNRNPFIDHPEIISEVADF